MSEAHSGAGGRPSNLHNLAPELTPDGARRLIRAGQVAGHTAGMAPGYMQGNLAILPKDLALPFAAYCQRNPKPCPLVGMSDVGDPMLKTLGDIDIRTDIPSYNVYRNGQLDDTVTDISDLWRDDFVAFVLGCSFSFEDALVKAGLPLRHHQSDKIVSMYRTNIDTVPAGPFRGPTVVSMRPFTTKDAIKAVEITARFGATHGAPLHLGNPSEIGIADIGKPDWGDSTDFEPGEIPVFWACGVTPQAAVEQAKPEICITHKPGSMLITDILSDRAGS